MWHIKQMITMCSQVTSYAFSKLSLIILESHKITFAILKMYYSASITHAVYPISWDTYALTNLD